MTQSTTQPHQEKEVYTTPELVIQELLQDTTAQVLGYDKGESTQ